MHKSFVIILFMVILPYMGHARQVNIIPAPQSVKINEGEFLLVPGNGVYADNAFQEELHFLQKELLRYQGLTTFTAENEKSASIFLKEDHCRDCLYQLEITKNQIVISSGSGEGIFYGIISLLQMVNNQKDNNARVLPCLSIRDKPEFGWRGLMLDESRHFFGKEKVKSILDWMAYYKLNRFHWHLTDAPGWRVEIKKYPKLTLVGGIGTQTDALHPSQYYTQDDIHEIIAYARERKIEIIPEIDMPGHATAANRAYPEFSGGGSVRYPEFTFHPAKEATYNYLTDVLKEVSVLFPSPMIHLGGDEVSFGSEKWNSDPAIQELMRRKSFTNLKEVENYFMQRMADTVFSLNKKVLAWDEMANANLPKDKSIIFWWRHDKPEQLKTSLENGYQTVICPRLPFYFDFVQKEDHRYGRKWSGSLYNDLASVYNFSIHKLPVDQKYHSHILGLQADIWTETVTNEYRLDFLMFPRVAALAEDAWTAENNKNYDNFLERLKSHMGLYKTQKVYYFDPFEPGNHPEPVIQ